MKLALRFGALLLVLAAWPASADIVLSGSQHLGDKANPAYTPNDPVTRVQMKSNPTNFSLSQTTVITAARLENAVNINKLRFFIDNMTTVVPGTQSGSTYTFTTPLTLSAGSHTVWPDGGCNSGSFALPCAGGENDFSFTDITLISAQTSTSRGDHRRWHVGDTKDTKKDFYVGKYYPDDPDGAAVNISFSLDIARVLSEVRFWRLRQVPVAPTSFPRVLVDGVLVGNLTGNGSPFILASSRLLAAGAHTLRVESGTQSGANLNDFSWDDIVLVLTNNPATTPSVFNAVDTGADAVSGQLQTKTAGSNFTVDLTALSNGALLTTYTGTVTVDLLDSSVTTGTFIAGTNCDSGWVSLGTLGTAVFTALNAGRKAFTGVYAQAQADARLRITDPLLGVTGCSGDNFAVKPSSFGSILVSHGSQTTGGTTTGLATSGFTSTTTPIHNAGRPFTVRATAYNALGIITTGYAGSPTLNAVSSLLGTNVGVASASAWTASGGTVRSDNATYSEVGAARIEIVDTTFAAVDTDDTPAASRQIGPASFDVGRFVPDHFRFDDATVGGAQFVPGCLNTTTLAGFTYIGRPFSFQTTPSATITAVAADGTTTTNYSGASLYKLPAGPLPQATLTPLTGTLDTTGYPNPDNSFVNLGGGVSLYTVVPRPNGYQFVRTTPVLPFDAEIALVLPSLSDSEGVTLSEPAVPGFGTLIAGGGIPFGITPTVNKQMRFGRMMMANAHGSERLPLNVPLRTEYWSTSGGVQGFVQNLDDSGAGVGCTALLPANFVLSPAGPSTASAVAAWVSGASQLTLSAPGAAETVNITANISASPLPAWLQPDDGDADLLYNNNPTATATFGVFKDETDRRVYQREVIGP